MSLWSFAATSDVSGPGNHLNAVKIDVLDVKGHVLKNLADQLFASGMYSVSWDATDKYGRHAGEGMYIISMKAEGIKSAARLSVIK